MKKIVLLFVFIFATQFYAQPSTVGLLYYQANTTDGYTLFTPQRNNETYLVNNCGEKVNQWSSSELPGATCYLLPNGNLLRAGRNAIEIRDWNNNLVWRYVTSANGINQHHDIAPLPNGNILCLSAEMYTLAEMTAQGRNPAITAATFKLDTVVEIQPVGSNGANIVWEWKFIDHMIQDFDASKLNYGIVADHSELIDLNYNNGSASDYTHCNSINYNAALDQILISIRHLNEIIIIDHSTTTAQASGHSGGSSNKGGDILWRWGNPEVYRQGTLADKKLFLQHDAKWVEDGYSDEGKITVFSNGVPGSTQPFSLAGMLQPEIVNGVYTKTNNRFNPANFDWSWNGSILGVTVNEPIMSGTHALPNGNMIISETSLGRVSEMTKSGTLLWSYRNPTGTVVAGIPTIYLQLANPAGDNAYFRAEKYPVNYVGFTGHDLTSATGIIENENTVSQVCIELGNNEFPFENIHVLNPAKEDSIQFNSIIEADTITIFDMNGRLVYNKKTFKGNKLEVNLNPAVYLMQIQLESSVKKLKIIISP